MYIGSVDRKKQTKNASNRKKMTTFGTKKLKKTGTILYEVLST
jgi:hypothetical protein